MALPTTERGDRSRAAILAAAEPIFAQRGYTGASLNDIIRASGLTKGGFYFHFSSKQELALAVVNAHQRRWIGQAMREAQAHPRAVDRLFEVPRVLGRLSREGKGPYALRLLVDELSRDPELRDAVCGSMTTSVALVTDQFRQAQAEGSIRPDVDPRAMAELAVGALSGLLGLTEQLGDDELERRVDLLIDTVQRATLVRPEERKEGTPYA